MGEVTAHAVAPFDDFGRGEICAAREVAVFDIVVNPIADGLHARKAVRNLPKLIPGEIHQFVRVAIAARQCVAQRLKREFPHRHNLTQYLAAIGQR